jgi:bifunctional DNA-binding transcriptional regulator/antitoxin component of YhaV-PrlF toxin-antitoxin module
LARRAGTVENTRVSSKGQMIIPKRVWEALGLKKGTVLAEDERTKRKARRRP